jgi:RHS repeat-associated protein
MSNWTYLLIVILLFVGYAPVSHSGTQLNPTCDADNTAWCNSNNHESQTCSKEVAYTTYDRDNGYFTTYWQCRCVNTGGVFVFGLYSCAVGYDQTAPIQKKLASSSRPQRQCGSEIDADRLSLGERIPVVGAPFDLVYSSDRTKGRASNYTATIPITKNPKNPNLSQVVLDISIGTRIITQTFSTLSNGLSYDFVWDGKDAAMNDVYMPFEIGLKYTSTYSPAATDYPHETSVVLGSYIPKPLGLGGWGLSIHHAYSPLAKTLYLGDGAARSVQVAPISGVYSIPADDASEVYNFDASGRHISTKFGLTGANKFVFSYDSQGRLASVTDAYGRVTTFDRSGGTLVSITSHYGQITTVTINAQGWLASVSNPKSETHNMTYYSADGMLYTFQKPRGQLSVFTYDSKGYLTSDANSAGNSWSISYVESGANQKSVYMTSALGRSHQYTSTIDATSEYNSSSPPAGSASNWSRTQYNLSTTENNSTSSSYFMNDPRFGSLAQFEYWGYQTLQGHYTPKYWSATKSASLSVATDPFSINTLTETYTQNSKVWNSVYNGSTKTFTLTSPVGRTSTLTVNSKQDVVQTQTASFAPIAFNYHSDGRLQNVVQGARTVGFGYNTKGQVQSITNPLMQTTSMYYDLAGRITSVTLPDNRYVSYNYDSNSNLISVTPPGRPIHSFSFNSKDLVSAYTVPYVAGGGGTAYTYNNDKQLTQIQRGGGTQTVSFTYGMYTGYLDSMSTPSGSYAFTWSSGNLTSGTSPDMVSNHLGYHGNSIATDVTRDASTYVDLGTVSNTRDADFRVSAQSVSGFSGSASSIAYSYDNDGLLSAAGAQTLTYDPTHGLLSETLLDTIRTDYTYNSYGETLSVVAKQSTTTKFSYSVTRDLLGRVATKQEVLPGPVTNNYTYTYDDAGRLTGVSKNGSPTSSYVYDSNSNLTSGTRNGAAVSATYDDQDRLTSYNGLTFTYNAAGDLASKTVTATSATTTFDYDVLGNLRSVVLPTKTISYAHDALGRRVTRKSGVTITARYLYDGRRLIAEIAPAGAVAKRYVYSSRGHVPDYAIIGGSTYRLLSDQVGSVRIVVNASTGAVAQQIDYDDFGRVTNDTSPGFQNFGFAGGMYDHETGLVRFGARDYDAEVGRWTAKDPIGFNGGDSNLYGYVLNDPINLIDPAGTNPLIAGILTGLLTIFNSTPTETPGAATSEVISGAATIGFGALGGLGGSAGAGAMCTGESFGNGIASGLTAHGAEQAAARGISNSAINSALTRSIGATAGAGRFGNTVTVFGQNGVSVVISTSGRNAGKIITVFSR